jgi:glycosyltransferase involved in cell wall biosynthesis
MRIAIDTSPILYGTGVSTYTRSLIKNLLKIDKDNTYILFGGSFRRFVELKSKMDFEGKNCIKKTLPFPPTLTSLIWNDLHILPIEQLLGHVDVFHSSDWAQPPSKAYKITTIHDLVPLLYPELSQKKLVGVHTKRLKRVKEEVDAIIVPSESTKKDLCKLGFVDEKIVVIPEAPSENVKKVALKVALNVLKKYRVGENFLLSVGIGPRKNTRNVISAYERVKAEMNLKLVILGYPYEKLDVPRGVFVLGHVSDIELSAFYSAAKVLVYPSLYEGFGLPILDSFKCGLPVVTSNFGSMKEVGGKAAVFVDPKSNKAIFDGIMGAMNEKKKLGALASKELEKYSWEKTAKMTLNVYKRVKGVG